VYAPNLRRYEVNLIDGVLAKERAHLGLLSEIELFAIGGEQPTATPSR
jgi:hypothetical protein